MAAIEMLARLKADTSGFTTAIKRAEDSLAQFGNSAQSFGSTVSDKMSRAGSSLNSFGDSAAKTGAMASLSLTTPLMLAGGTALRTASDFESSMSQVAQAVGLPASQVKDLSDLAIQMGASTQFSANEAAQAMVELAKGGFDPAAISGGALNATMSLAAAGGLQLADAGTQIVASMNSFGLSAGQSSQIADALAGAANASAADVSDLGQALTQAASQAAVSGQSLQGTTAALAAMADMGIKGSDAGTSLKTMLTRLIPATDEAAGAMADYGLNFVNADGSMKSLTEVAGQLKSQLGGLGEAEKSKALETIFGTDAMRGAAAMMNVGAEGMAKYEAATSAAGNATSAAAARMGPTQKAMEELSGAVETGWLKVGEVMAPVIADLAEKANTLVSRFTELSPPVQRFIVIAGAGLAAVGPVLGGIGIAAKIMGTGLAAVGKVVSGVGWAFSKLGAVFNIVKNGIYMVRVAWAALSVTFTTTPIGWIVLAIAALVGALILAYNKIPAFRQAVQDAFAKVKEVIGNVVDWLKPKIAAAMDWMRQAWQWAMDNIVPKVVEAFGVIKNIISNVMEVVGKIVTWVWPYIVTYVKTYLTVLWNYISGVFTVIVAIIKAAWTVIMAIVRFAVDYIWPVVKVAFEIMRNIIQTVMGVIAAVVRVAWNIIMAIVRFAVDYIWPVVQVAFNIIKGIVEGVMTVVSAIIRTTWNVIMAVVRFAVEYIWPIVQGAFNIIKNIITTVMDVVSAIIRTSWGIIQRVIQVVMDYIWPVIKTVFTNISSFISSAMNIIWGVIETVWSVIKAIFTVTMTVVWNIVKNVFTGIWNTISTIMQTVWGVIQTVWNAIYSTVSTVVGFIWNAVQAGFQFIWNIVSTVMTTVWNFLTMVWNAIWNTITTVVGWIWNVVTNGFNNIRDTISNVMAVVKDFIGGAWEWIKGVWDNSVGRIISATADAFGTVRDKIGDALDKVKSLFTDAVDRIGAIWDKVTDVVKAPIRGMFSWINDNMINPINDVLGKFGDSVKIKNLPSFADGGMVRGPGTGRSDSVLARVSNREFVVNAKATKDYLPILTAINNGQTIPGTDAPPPAGLAAAALPGASLGVGGGIGDFASNAISSVVGAVSSGVSAITGLVARGAAFAAGAILDPALGWLREKFGGSWAGNVIIGAMQVFADEVKKWGSAQDAAAAAAVVGGSAEAQVANFFKSEGFSDAGVAGALANFAQESAFNPGAVEPSPGTGIGLAQWSFSRADALRSFAASRNMPWTDIATQFAFIRKEVAENAAFRALWDRMRSATDAVAASQDFDAVYEGSGVKGSRFDTAAAYLAKVRSGVYNAPAAAAGEWQLPTSNYVVSSEYGYRQNPTGSGTQLHSGIDLAAMTGRPVWAAAQGLVTQAGWYDGYGNFVAIDHGGGLATQYGHMSAISVSAGQTVPRGAVVGAVGTTGDSTGPHLHFNTLENGGYVDPRSFMGARGVMFDTGGVLPRGTTVTTNNTGKPEAILTSAQWASLASASKAVSDTVTYFRQAGPGASLGDGRGGGGPYGMDWATFWKGAAKAEGGFWEWAKKIDLTVLKSSTEAIDGFRDAVVKMSDDARKSAIDFAKLSSVAPSGERGWDIGATITALAQRADRIKQFNAALAQLQQAGLSQAAMADLVSMGPDQGLAAARAMLSGASRIAELNAVYKDIADTAQVYGDTAAGVQSGRTGAEVAGLRTTTVTLAPGSVVINFGAGASASDRAAVRKEVESALKDAMDALAKEINRS